VSLYLVPVTWQDVRAFTTSWHRHHPDPPAGHKFSTGAAADRVLVGVVIVGRPTARGFDDPIDLVHDEFTLEATRTVTDGFKNANSMLYGAAARGAFAQGYTRVITYTEEGESGASLKAAGWRIIAERPARGGWDCPSRPRKPSRSGIARTLWEQTA
jgi:hypothetical protein